jgi:hypothetical protein
MWTPPAPHSLKRSIEIISIFTYDLRDDL